MVYHYQSHFISFKCLVSIFFAGMLSPLCAPASPVPPLPTQHANSIHTAGSAIPITPVATADPVSSSPAGLNLAPNFEFPAIFRQSFPENETVVLLSAAAAMDPEIRFSGHTLDKATKAKVTLENYYSNLISQHRERKHR